MNEWNTILKDEDPNPEISDMIILAEPECDGYIYTLARYHGNGNWFANGRPVDFGDYTDFMYINRKPEFADELKEAFCGKEVESIDEFGGHANWKEYYPSGN